MIGRARHFNQLWRHFGPRWMLYRAGYRLRMRAGLIQRASLPVSWDDRPLHNLLKGPALADPEAYLAHRRERASSFFFTPCDRQAFQPRLAQWDAHEDDPRSEHAKPAQLADEIVSGVLRYFDHTPVHVGFPPAWHTNPFTRQTALVDRHWSKVGDFGQGDIKIIWEPSRFGFVFALVRAYWRTNDERFAEAFWTAAEDWRANNPPQLGSNWKCGQETSFRVMAWCFGLHGFLDARATTAQRVAMLAQMIAVSGQRIAMNIAYALSQYNNHGISEAMGLWTIGVLFPEFQGADSWKQKGRRELERQARELIYDDGAFSQHSLNYHRLMLHNYVWSARLGEIAGEPLSAELSERVGRAGELLYQLQDERTGHVPCYGANDGALILPLSNCSYWDMRPVEQSACYFANRTKQYRPGPWDEELLWLFGVSALTATERLQSRVDLEAREGGYFTLRDRDGFIFIRCTNFRHRPGQADVLHADVWWRGQNVALDPATFSYNAPPPWDQSFERSVYHNTVTVDGQDQMQRVGRFLWLPWLHAIDVHLERDKHGHLVHWAGGHDGYARLRAPAWHRRTVERIGGDMWLIVDRLHSEAAHDYRLHWLFLDCPYEWDEAQGQMSLKTPQGRYYVRMSTLSRSCTFSLVRADEATPRGWRALHYWERTPALSVDLTVRDSTTTVWTLLGPDACNVKVEETTLKITSAEWSRSIDLSSEIYRPSEERTKH